MKTYDEIVMVMLVNDRLPPAFCDNLLRHASVEGFNELVLLYDNADLAEKEKIVIFLQELLYDMHDNDRDVVPIVDIDVCKTIRSTLLMLKDQKLSMKKTIEENGGNERVAERLGLPLCVLNEMLSSKKAHHRCFFKHINTLNLEKNHNGD